MCLRHMYVLVLSFGTWGHLGGLFGALRSPSVSDNEGRSREGGHTRSRAVPKTIPKYRHGAPLPSGDEMSYPFACPQRFRVFPFHIAVAECFAGTHQFGANPRPSIASVRVRRCVPPSLGHLGYGGERTLLSRLRLASCSGGCGDLGVARPRGQAMGRPMGPRSGVSSRG